MTKNKKVKGQASTLRDGIIICTDFTAIRKMLQYNFQFQCHIRSGMTIFSVTIILQSQLRRPSCQDFINIRVLYLKNKRQYAWTGLTMHTRFLFFYTS